MKLEHEGNGMVDTGAGPAPFDHGYTPQTVPRYVQPEDVTLPATRAEGVAALAFIDRSIAYLRGVEAHYERNGWGFASITTKIHRWQMRRDEIVYATARLESAESDPAIAARLDDAVSQLVDARTRIAVLEHEARASKERIAGLLTDLARAQSRSREVVEADKAARVRPLHDMIALAVAVVHDMVKAGAPMTPLAEHVVKRVVNGLPAGFWETWQEKNLPRLIERAEEAREAGETR